MSATRNKAGEAVRKRTASHTLDVLASELGECLAAIESVQSKRIDAEEHTPAHTTFKNQETQLHDLMDVLRNQSSFIVATTANGAALQLIQLSADFDTLISFDFVIEQDRQMLERRVARYLYSAASWVRGNSTLPAALWDYAMSEGCNPHKDVKDGRGRK